MLLNMAFALPFVRLKCWKEKKKAQKQTQGKDDVEVDRFENQNIREHIISRAK